MIDSYIVALAVRPEKRQMNSNNSFDGWMQPQPLRPKYTLHTNIALDYATTKDYMGKSIYLKQRVS